MKFLHRLTVLLLMFLLFYGFIHFGSKESNQQTLVSLSSEKMDANTISIWFRNNGSFNRDPVTGNAGFEWPKGTNKFARYASGIMIGAKYNSDTLVSYAMYDYEYLPGFTDGACVSQGSTDPDYRIYKLTYGIDNADRTQWPNSLLGNSNQGAPVFFDNQSNMWKALDYGNQTMFYSLTESYEGAHNYTQPIKIDIKQVNYAFNQSGALQNTVFTQLKIINRCGRTLNDVYISFWTDDDIGANVLTDRCGCDSLLQLGYTYKGPVNDPAYGTPPAVGTLFLKGADYFTGVNTDTVRFCEGKNLKIKTGYKQRGMESFIRYTNGDPLFGDFTNYKELYRNMNGLSKTGQPIMNPDGYVTKLSFSGDPVTNTGWVETSSGDRRFMMTTGPINMVPGDTQYIVFAQIIAQGSSNLNSVQLLKQYALDVRNYYENNCFSEVTLGVNNISTVAERFSLNQNYPNPFNPATKIEFSLPSSGNTTLKIFDAAGREVTTLVNETLNMGTYSAEWDASGYSSGVYFYRLEKGDYSLTRKMVLMK